MTTLFWLEVTSHATIQLRAKPKNGRFGLGNILYFQEIRGEYTFYRNGGIDKNLGLQLTSGGFPIVDE
jgi:hypothetical protein